MTERKIKAEPIVVNTGERGPKGDNGQDGRQGHPGHQGPVGAAGKLLNRNQTLTIFAFVILAFGLLAFRTETNSSQLRASDHATRVNAWQGCIDGNSILKQFDALNNTIADIEKQQVINLDLAQARIDAYHKAVVPLRNCGPKP